MTPEKPAKIKRRTKFEKINARVIPADVKVFVEQAPGFEAELGEVMPAIVTHEHEAAGFHDLERWASFLVHWEISGIYERNLAVCSNMGGGWVGERKAAAARTCAMLEMARGHSDGCRALRTNTRTRMSAECSARSEGGAVEDRSQTEAVMVPQGGAVYRGLC